MKDSRPKYDIYLDSPHGGSFGDRQVQVFHALKNAAPQIAWNFELFGKISREQTPVYKWGYLTPEETEEIKKIFAPLELQLRIEQVESVFLFPSSDLDGFENDWFSRSLLSLGEDALDDWAVSQNVIEAYRFTEILSFDPAITIRVWQENAIRKEGIGTNPYEPTSIDTQSWTTQKSDWAELKHVLDETAFWANNSWYSVPEGYGVLDGELLLIEAYKNRSYKFLYDHSPQSGAAYIAMQFFLGLKPANG